MIVEQRWRILSAVSVGTFMATLDGSIVNISLPSIGRAFGIDLVAVQWVVVAYLLVVGATLLPFGRLGEVLTFRRVYLAGFALFTVASVLCGAAPGPVVLVAFRALQGVGAGMLQAMGPAIVARTFPAGERGRALGINAISVSVGLSLGPALGGLLTEFGTWRAIFLVNLPVGIFALLWAARVLPAEDRTARTAFDVRGAAFGSAALFAILLALSEGQGWGWSSPAVLGLLAGAVLLGAGFLVTERRALLPMIDLALFRIRAFSAGLAAVVLAFGALFTATFLLPFLLENGAGFTPLETGFLLTPVPIATAIVAPLSGSFSDRHGSRLPASVGLLLMAGGLLALGALPDPFSVPDLDLAPHHRGGRPGAVHQPEQQRGARRGAPGAPRHGLRDDRPDADPRPDPRHRPRRRDRGRAHAGAPGRQWPRGDRRGPGRGDPRCPAGRGGDLRGGGRDQRSPRGGRPDRGPRARAGEPARRRMTRPGPRPRDRPRDRPLLTTVRADGTSCCRRGRPPTVNGRLESSPEGATGAQTLSGAVQAKAAARLAGCHYGS